jgi:hypothetical protein
MRSPIIILVLATLLALGCEVRAQADSKGTATVSGKVSIEGSPAGDVAVMLLKPDGPSDALPVARVSADAEGNYRLTGIATGQYGLIAFAPGFYCPANEAWLWGKSITLREGDVVDGIDFKLVRGGVITGRITDASGKPVAEEFVALTRVDEYGEDVVSRYENDYGNDHETDDRGVYRIYGLEPGRYLVSVGSTEAHREWGGAGRFYQQTFYPGVTARAKANIVQVGPGAVASRADIVLGKIGVTYAISGRVINAATGTGAPGMLMGFGRAQPGEPVGIGGGTNPEWQSDPAGYFRIQGISPGRYAVFGVPEQGSDFYSDPGYFDVVDRDVNGVEVRLHRGATITGFVVPDQVTDPSIRARLAGLELAITNATRDFIQSPAAIAPDGSFSISGVPPGQNRLSLATTEAKGFYILNVVRDGGEQPGGLIDVQPDELVTGIRVAVGYGAGVIRGQVKFIGGTPPDGARIIVTCSCLAAQRIQSVMADSRGLFVVEGLSDGEADLTVSVLGNTEGRHIQPLRRAVTVTQGAPTEVELLVDLSQ